MCESMADIQSPTAEIRLGKKIEDRAAINILTLSIISDGVRASLSQPIKSRIT